MFRILENGQVLKVQNTNGNIIETHYCMVTETRRERVDDYYRVTVLEFDQELGTQVVISEELEPVPREVLLQELKDKYLPLIRDADLLGDTEEKTRLQQEYLQKKNEIESD